MNGLGEVALSLSDYRPRKCVTFSWAVRSWLSGIDCPEKGQAYGQKAKHAASDLAFGKDVTIQTHGLDKYGRTLADVLLLDGTNVNHELVKEG
jgi:endonuclease YncB( thermonuclease family)